MICGNSYMWNNTELIYAIYNLHIFLISRTDYRNRHKYEHALITLGYGHLLSVWDRREDEGRRLIEEAEAMMTTIPSFYGGMKLSHMIQYPI